MNFSPTALCSAKSHTHNHDLILKSKCITDIYNIWVVDSWHFSVEQKKKKSNKNGCTLLKFCHLRGEKCLQLNQQAAVSVKGTYISEEMAPHHRRRHSHCHINYTEVNLQSKTKKNKNKWTTTPTRFTCGSETPVTSTSGVCGGHKQQPWQSALDKF